MSNQEKTARIIATAQSECHSFEPEVCGACYNHLVEGKWLAKRLADAALLAPDLPTPHIFTPDTDPEWAQNYLEEWEWLPDAQIYSTQSTFYLNVKDGNTDGGFEFSQEEWLNMSPAQLREIAAILLAAADYAEGKRD